ncbi:MAG: hypothetical protein HC862_03220 [Scytonema sp. RU_4_4]|nr:hypothetical protein [Scytonema sp. RU_4_4]NJR73519.1 hypothetical protein [Scytonema sp. CRU_2_7]
MSRDRLKIAVILIRHLLQSTSPGAMMATEQQQSTLLEEIENYQREISKEE